MLVWGLESSHIPWKYSESGAEPWLGYATVYPELCSPARREPRGRCCKRWDARWETPFWRLWVGNCTVGWQRLDGSQVEETDTGWRSLQLAWTSHPAVSLTDLGTIGQELRLSVSKEGLEKRVIFRKVGSNKKNSMCKNMLSKPSNNGQT